MKSYAEIQEAKARRDETKRIKEFNETLKVSPSLLNDEFFLFQNINNIYLKLKQFPQKHLDNILLMTEYFKKQRDNVNFKYIKTEFLNNPMFVSHIITANPELFFLLSDKNKSIFKETVIKKDSEYLKYLSKEDYDNPVRAKDISFQIERFNESLSCITPEILNKLIKGQYGEHLEKNILKLNLEKCRYMKVALNSYLEENKKAKGELWFYSILEKNPHLYVTLNKEDYMDEKNKSFIINLIGKYHNLFTELPNEWKNDIEVVINVIENTETTEYKYKNFGNNYHANVKDIGLVLNEYGNPEKLLEENEVRKADNLLQKIEYEKLVQEIESRNDTNPLEYIDYETIKKIEEKKCISLKNIRNIYPQLTQEWREQEVIIKSLFKERDNFCIDLDFCRSIPHEELAENLVNQLKSKNFPTRELSEVGETLEKVVDYYYLKQKLALKNTTDKKLKI